MRIIAFFQTLRGQMILTYTTVTVLALLALEVTILIVVFLFSNGTDTNTNAYLSDVISVLPPQARIYLQPGTRDLDGLQTWLEDTYAGGYASLPAQGILDSPAAPILKSEPMYVVSPDGIILAAAPTRAHSLIGRVYSPPSNVSGSRNIFDNALQRNLQTDQVSARRPDGNYLMAVPVLENRAEGPLVAVIIVTVRAPTVGINPWWPTILGIVLVTGLVLLLAVAPFGTLFGFFMSRGLTRRLQALTLAADAWSEGDFTIQPYDRQKDEVSYLGMRMRNMAERIQDLLSAQKALAILEERNRMARELHDTVKQENFATLMQVRAAKNLLDRDPLAARTHLEEAENLIKNSQQDLGLIISELRPSTLENQGLAGALSAYLDNWSQNSRIPANFEVQNEQRLPLEVEQTLFRVAQEALSNVARHSRASAATVRLAYEPGQVTLCVADNGIGLDPMHTSSTGATSSGFGLQSMHERMEAIEGQLILEAAPGGGAAVTASAPTLCQEDL